MRKILVLRGGALGDFIVTLPALALLRQRWPEARIELAGNATAAQLARARGLLDAVHAQDEARWSELFRDGHAPLAPEFAAWLADFDLVLNYWPDADGHLQRRFPLRAGQTFLSAAALPACAPAAAHYCAPLRALGVETTDTVFSLQPLQPDDGELPPIALHPGSGSPRKNWPAQNWRRLVERLPDRATFILGEAELERSGEFLRPHAPWVSLVRPGLEELVAYFARCDLFLGHDSGISHLAAACGARCVLLFGPTDPAVWAPPAPNVRILRRDADLASIPLEDVERAASAALADRT